VRPRKIFLVASAAIIIAMLAVLLPAIPVLAAPTISLSTTSGTVGTFVSISGSGFTSGTVTIHFGSDTFFSGTVAADTTLTSTAFTVPSRPRNNYNVYVTTSGGDTSNTIVFTITPTISTSSSSGYVGDSFYVSGTGFSISSPITIYFDSTTTSTTSDSNGAFPSTVVTIPPTYRGSHTVRASDSVGSSPSFSYTVSPKIAISSPTAVVGSPLTVSGSGFAASAPLTFYLDDVNFPGAGTTDGSGNIPATTVTVPAVSGGGHTLKVQDSSGGSATASLTVSAAVFIAPLTGPASTMVTVTGKGFGANKGVTITWKSGAITTNPTSVNTDSGGNFTASFTVPAGLAGSYPVGATDGTLSGSASFNMMASTTMSSNKGKVGTSITISGGGFNVGAQVSIKYDSQTIKATPADASGEISTAITIPAGTAGNHTITASDGVSIITSNFTVESSASLSQNSGYVGSEVTITGTGFSAGKTVTIKYDDNLMPATATDANGNFSGSFKAPASKGGNHTITVTDGVNVATGTFAMDSIPPPLPANLLPANESNADALARFSWTASTDPSGVTYELQVAADANIANIILNKKGLVTPGYQATEAEKFKSAGGDAPYYWRVKAIDGAGNESDWTKPQSFTVGFTMPTWGIYTIFGVICILVGLAGFWVGRKTSYRWDW